MFAFSVQKKMQWPPSLHSEASEHYTDRRLTTFILNSGTDEPSSFDRPTSCKYEQKNKFFIYLKHHVFKPRMMHPTFLSLITTTFVVLLLLTLNMNLADAMKSTIQDGSGRFIMGSGCGTVNPIWKVLLDQGADTSSLNCTMVYYRWTSVIKLNHDF